MAFVRRTDPCYHHVPDPSPAGGWLLALLVAVVLVAAHNWLDSVAAVLAAAAVVVMLAVGVWWWIGELRLQRECRLSHAEYVRHQETQRALEASPTRLALPAPNLPPLKAGTFVIDAEEIRR